MPKARMMVVRCGPSDWGNERMAALAKEAFEGAPEVDVVDVYEHGGWRLAYNRSGLVVGTANDMAVMGPAVREFWGQFSGVEYAGSL